MQAWLPHTPCECSSLQQRRRGGTALPKRYREWLISHQHRKRRRREKKKKQTPAWVVTFWSLNTHQAVRDAPHTVNPRRVRSGRTSVGHLTPYINFNCVLPTLSFISRFCSVALSALTSRRSFLTPFPLVRFYSTSLFSAHSTILFPLCVSHHTALLLPPLSL